MKTAVKIFCLSCASIGVLYAASAIAQGMASATLSPAPVAKSETKPLMPKIDTPNLGEADFPLLDPVKTGPKKNKDDEVSSGKVPESVKGVVKRLNSATEDITIEDLNSAREAIAKLDVLIDIEKRLSDLAEIREEREEKTLSKAIPASALGLPSRSGMAPPIQNFPQQTASITPTPSPAPAPVVAPQPPPPAEIEVGKIIGARGRYSALVKVGDAKPKQVKEGDKLSDGSVIQNISSDGVTIVKDKNMRSISVKDVAAVFGGH